MFSRRIFMKMLLAQSVFTACPSTLFANNEQKRYADGFYSKPFTTALNVPSDKGYMAYTDASAQYSIEATTTTLVPEMNNTMGAVLSWYTQDVQGTYFSPTLEAKHGSSIRLIVMNTMPKNPMSPYITGLITEDNSIGSLFNPIKSKATYRIHYSVVNPASTCIYTSMHLGNSGFYMHQGLSGIMCISDTIEQNLNTRYMLEKGVSDIPLFIQDKRLSLDGEYVYALQYNDMLGGYLGNMLLVNGGIYPTLDVSNRVYKFRIVNGSNARMLYLGFKTSTTMLPMHIISTGRGLLEKTITANTMYIAPSERVEILLDLRAMKGEKIYLINYPFNSMRATKGYVKNIFTTIEERGAYCLALECKQTFKPTLPPIPSNIGNPLPSMGVTTTRRIFILRNTQNNGAVQWFFESPDIFENELLLKNNTLEEWEFINPIESIPQCIYIPYLQTQLIQRANSPSQMRSLAINTKGILATDSGSKDSICIWPGERIIIKVRIPKTRDKEILLTIHSKILETFDRGMILLTRII